MNLSGKLEVQRGPWGQGPPVSFSMGQACRCHRIFAQAAPVASTLHPLRFLIPLQPQLKHHLPQAASSWFSCPFSSSLTVPCSFPLDLLQYCPILYSWLFSLLIGCFPPKLQTHRATVKSVFFTNGSQS